MERERVFLPDIKSLVMSGITVACLFLSEFMFPQVLERLSNKPSQDTPITSWSSCDDKLCSTAQI